MRRATSKRMAARLSPLGPAAGLASLLVAGCASVALAAAGRPRAGLIPWPRSVTFRTGDLAIHKPCRVVAEDEELAPLAEVLSRDIYMISGLRLATARGRERLRGRARSGDIVLRLNPRPRGDAPVILAVISGGEAYRLAVGARGAVIEAGNYRGAAWGVSTLLQALKVAHGKVTVPYMTVEDAPVARYRGLLIDVARQWHPVESLRPIIQMCSFYKINYIQLHLNDQQSTVFPSKAFPELRSVYKGKRRHYTWEELTDLVRFADERGVTLVPELEGPGHHSGNLRRLWGRKGTSCLDMGSERTYEGLKVLIGEICEVFKSSPYLHIGADECSLAGVGNSEEEKAFMAKHGLKGRGGLYNYYIKRTNEIVKSYGKQTICWEGFHGGGGGGVEIPKDIIVMPFESAYNTADNLVRRGFTVINTAWKPLYVVNNRKWPARYIFEEWNMWLWQHHVRKTVNIQLKRTDPVIGAQMCAWEQPAYRELPSTRERVHAMGERIWDPDAGRTWEDFAARARVADALLDRLLGAVTIRAEGLLGKREREFEKFRDPITVHLSAASIGTIHYEIDAHDERGSRRPKEPTADSPTYTAPFTVSAADARTAKIWWNTRIKRCTAKANVVTIKARLFGPDRKPVGDVTSRAFYMHGEPEEGRF